MIKLGFIRIEYLVVGEPMTVRNYARDELVKMGGSGATIKAKDAFNVYAESAIGIYNQQFDTTEVLKTTQDVSLSKVIEILPKFGSYLDIKILGAPFHGSLPERKMLFYNHTGGNLYSLNEGSLLDTIIKDDIRPEWVNQTKEHKSGYITQILQGHSMTVLSYLSYYSTTDKTLYLSISPYSLLSDIMGIPYEDQQSNPKFSAFENSGVSVFVKVTSDIFPRIIAQASQQQKEQAFRSLTEIGITSSNLDEKLIEYVVRGDRDTVALMLLAGANPNYISPSGQTALTSALMNRKNNVASDLMKAGADPSLINRDGQTAADFITGPDHPLWFMFHQIKHL